MKWTACRYEDLAGADRSIVALTNLCAGSTLSDLTFSLFASMDALPNDTADAYAPLLHALIQTDGTAMLEQAGHHEIEAGMMLIIYDETALH